MSAVPTEQDLARLVYREARLIDERRFDEWYALYADDAFYWVPLVPGQPDGENHTSLMYEDKLLLKLLKCKLLLILLLLLTKLLLTKLLTTLTPL